MAIVILLHAKVDLLHLLFTLVVYYTLYAILFSIQNIKSNASEPQQHSIPSYLIGGLFIVGSDFLAGHSE